MKIQRVNTHSGTNLVKHILQKYYLSIAQVSGNRPLNASKLNFCGLNVID